MTDPNSEYEVRKRAIFDGMSKRGQERVLRLGYENWEPFPEPKDPREQIRSSVAMKADALVKHYYSLSPAHEGARAFHHDLVQLCIGIMRGDLHSQIIYEFCNWYRDNRP
jgi:hypothetical protein